MKKRFLKCFFAVCGVLFFCFGQFLLGNFRLKGGFGNFFALASQTTSESEVASASQSGNSFALTIVIVLVLFVVVGTLAGVALYHWFKNGGTVAPLSQKEIYSINKKKSLKQSDFEDYVSSQNFDENDDVVNLENSDKEGKNYPGQNSANGESGDFPEDL